MTLARMQWRQFFRGDKKSSTIGLALSAVYMWMMELMLFFLLKDSGVEVPVMAAVGVIAAFLVFDFIIKLFLQRDNTVMDASLKTRPVPQREWRRFLGLSHFWSPLNLEMPLAMAPACFLFLPAGLAFIVFPAFYLASVFGGFLVMLINPSVLILDEPFNYLDPSSQLVVARLIREMNRDFGTTVIVSSHNLSSIYDICGRILLLEKGHLLKDLPHIPGSRDEELESYFMEAVR